MPENLLRCRFKVQSSGFAVAVRWRYSDPEPDPNAGPAVEHGTLNAGP